VQTHAELPLMGVLFADPIFGEAISKRVVEQIVAQCGQKCGHAFFFEFRCRYI
jgi:hypothetical protein